MAGVGLIFNEKAGIMSQERDDWHGLITQREKVEGVDSLFNTSSFIQHPPHCSN